MNYEKYGNGHKYPFGVNPAGTSPGTNIDTNIDVSYFVPSATCNIRLADNNDTTSGDTDLDQLVATGYYKGRTAKISVKIRGANQVNGDMDGTDYVSFGRTGYSCGIPEAFNKHVIYTTQVSGTGTTVKGNITTTSTKPGPFPWSEATWVETGINIPALNVNATPTDIPISSSDPTDTYDNSGFRNTTYNVNTVTDGVWWNGGTSTYYFGTDDGTTSSDYTRNDSQVDVQNADVWFLNGVNLGNYFKISDTTTIESAIFINPSKMAIECSTINIGTAATSAKINGDLVVNGSCTISSNHNANELNGALAGNGNITISNQPIKIDASTSSRKAATLIKGVTVTLTLISSLQITLGDNQISAILVHATDGTINVNADLTPTLGDNQISAILVYATNGTININADIIPDYSSTNQFCIVNWSGASADVNIGTSGTNINVNGGIYSYHKITLDTNTQTVTGILVAGDTAGGTVTLNGGSLVYDTTPFKKNPEIYKGFVGGRRVYLPVVGSWRIE